MLSELLRRDKNLNLIEDVLKELDSLAKLMLNSDSNFLKLKEIGFKLLILVEDLKLLNNFEAIILIPRTTL